MPGARSRPSRSRVLPPVYLVAAPMRADDDLDDTNGGALERVQPVQALGPVRLLAELPEEEIWLQSQQSPQTRRAYRNDVREFVEYLRIGSAAELHQVDRAHILAWQRHLDRAGAKPSTVRRKLAALSSLYAHLVDRHVVGANPVRDVGRPRINRKTGSTPAFSREQARALLDAPDATAIEGLRDRALLAVGLQVGLRRSSIVRLAVRDFHQNAGYDCLRMRLKGGVEHVVAVHPNVAQRIREYLQADARLEDLDSPLFCPTPRGSQGQTLRRHMEAGQVDRIVKKWARAIGAGHGYSAHSMRATFITTALANGASLEDVQEAAGHADPDTTKLYDRRGYNPEKSASFFAVY
ncbi:MAG: tyrosine-type recombinase/integrase [Propionibacteriaceae bacterium]|nr:tyrosine-type recombinase/integrase [Propionibacteriaceae bacterium]